ncbi:MAG: hypothetical protein KBC53_09325 [Nitrosomonas sp.]|nr:hypothetical protein [Nitrosomonas sp.]
MIEQRLPKISVKVDTSNILDFIKRIEIIVRDEGCFSVVASYTDQDVGNSYDLYITPENVQQTKATGRITGHCDNSERVDLQIAVQFDAHFTYDDYVTEIFGLFKPIISKYNQRFSSRRRITVQSKSDLLPKLPKATEKVFQIFIARTSKGGLHPSEWKYFYEFIGACHDYRVKLDEDDLVYLLYANGFSENNARKMGGTYFHVREFLLQYKRMKYKRFPYLALFEREYWQ